MMLAIDIKKQFPDLRVFDHDELAFVKAVLYKGDVQLLEIRIEPKEENHNFADNVKEYWITSRIVSIPAMPKLPSVRNEGTKVVSTKIDLFRNIEDMLSYARSI